MIILMYTAAFISLTLIPMDLMMAISLLNASMDFFVQMRRKKDKNYSVDEVYLEDYGIAGKRLARILRGFRDLPIHVIYIAHKKDKMRQGTNTLEESKPNLTEKLGTAVMGYMDFVWYLYTADEVVGSEETGYSSETHRYLLTQPMNNFAAKTRGAEFAQRIGSVIKDPNMVKIMSEYSKK